MSFLLEFLPEALADAECIVGDYWAKDEKLGTRFRLVLESACGKIAENPLLWRERKERFRRVNLPGFPYYLAFILSEDKVVIVAVAHAKRHPGYWKDRL